MGRPARTPMARALLLTRAGSRRGLAAHAGNLEPDPSLPRARAFLLNSRLFASLPWHCFASLLGATAFFAFLGAISSCSLVFAFAG